MISQSAHFGAVSGMTWMPLGLWGIDEAVERRDWRPLWKTALASAMCFLAGYPPSWVVFCATVTVYALTGRGHFRAAAGACAAIAASVLLSMVQVLPALEARSFMLYGEKYGGGADSWRDLIRFLVPSWQDFSRSAAVMVGGSLYLYFGLATLFAIGWAARRFLFRPYAQGIVTGTFCLILATNPDFLPYRAISQSRLLESVVVSINFYEGIAPMAALLTAIALHDFLARGSKRTMPRWAMPGAIAVLAAWSIRQIWIWKHGAVFAIGGRAVAETAIALILFSAAIWTLRAESGRRRVWLTAALLLAVGIDYKVNGTSRQFNTVNSDADLWHPAYGIGGVNDDAYRALWANRDYRIASDEQGAPQPTDYRHWGLASGQGFDPFLPAQYREFIERFVPFKTNRLFYMDFGNERMLQALGIRYVFTHEGVGIEARLAADPNFHLVGGSTSFYRIYEYRHARAPFGFEDGSGDVRPTEWMPERRAFRVRSERGGRFTFVEQFFPGWSATVDGRTSSIQRWNNTFQAIQVGPGEHTVIFEYHTRHLLTGAAVSFAATIALLAVVAADRRKKRRHTIAPAPVPECAA
jgi:hypothetical protein